MKNVTNFLYNILKKNDIVVVACSGGPDSMALLDLLSNLDIENLKIICAHVNHNVRKESKEEEKMVKKYCQKNKIIFESMIIEKEIKNNFEMEARKIRYKFFEIIVKKYGASYLFTAHHGDDLIETILMRLNRGSTLKGYKGIDLVTKKNNYSILRPLLWVSKTDLEKYVRDKNLLYAIDASNNEDSHTRNRFRNYVLPFLKKENYNVHLKYKYFSEELKQYDDFIENYIKKNCLGILKNNIINIEQFLKEEKLIQKKIIERILNNIYDGYLEIINQKHVEQILKLIIRNVNNSKINLPKGYIGIIDYGYFKIIRNIKKEYFNIVISNDLELDCGKFLFLKESDEKSNYVLRLNSQEIELPLHVRNRINGDKILIKNLNNYKKVSDILTNEKIKYGIRQNISIVTDNSGKILWIPGVKKSNLDKEKNEKYDIIIKYISNWEENYE